MASLERTLRKDLEKTVKQARRVAEAGARKAIEQLGVGEAEAPKHLTAEQRALRNRLRAHGRQLGDRRDPKGVQATKRLVQECAYEHWHRMLFARFLAETDLLIEPESGVAITLDEVQELAREKATDWLPLASDYAERMLPQIFRKDDPVLDIALPPETRSEMEDLLKGLTKPVFEADDSLGWVYQFWQSDKKDEVNKSEVKIGADELPAVTQLFTEDYMVLFLLHNTLGAWWAGKVLAANPSLAASEPDEAALRTACKVGDIDWTYLRFVRETAEDGTEGLWRPAAGVFEGWPKAAKDLTVLDPCMGSGHFLVFALPILVAFRIVEEGLSQTAAVDAVLTDNLFGLEIDPRCTQIAAFNLAFAAWRKVGYRPLPQINLACSGLAIGVTKAEWLRLAEKAVTAADPAAKRDLLGFEQNLLTVGLEERVKNGLEALYDLFAKAPWLGSLIDPRRTGADIFREGFDKLEPLLETILSTAETDEVREMAVAAQGMAKASELLTRDFTLAVTNVPFLGRGKQSDNIKSHIETYYADAKSDLATAMLRRILRMLSSGGTVAAVTPQNWLFLGSFKDLRKRLLNEAALATVAALGSRAFETISGEVVNAVLIALSRVASQKTNTFLGVDCNSGANPSTKSLELSNGAIRELSQIAQLANPDHRIVVADLESGPTLDAYAQSFQGIKTGDDSRYRRNVWEIGSATKQWRYIQTTVESTLPFGGLDGLVDWRDDGRHLARLQGLSAHSRVGCAVSQMSDLPTSIYLGFPFDSNVSAIVPINSEDDAAVWAFCSSPQYRQMVRKLEPSMKANNAVLAKVPFNVTHWRNVAAEKYPVGLPKPYSDSPIQWIYHGHPAKAGAGTTLQVGLARLLGYRWPGEVDASMSLAPEARDLIAESAALNACCPPDVDGIVCLTAIKGEPPGEQRLNALLGEAFGAGWSAAKLAGLLTEASHAGKSLDDWLRDGFFAQHCELFYQRPFIWHIWDGRRDGFHALVNYHRLVAPNGEGRRTLEKLIYSYLGDWIDDQRKKQQVGVEGADARLAHAEHLKAELIRILEGEPPYDIFVRWKPLHEQPIGWDPDINDGVRMNIRPFMTARPLGAKAKGACILRATPKIKWDKDRGKEPTRDKADYPWFWSEHQPPDDFLGGEKFHGNRWNDLHYSHAIKQAARDRAKSGAKP